MTALLWRLFFVVVLDLHQREHEQTCFILIKHAVCDTSIFSWVLISFFFKQSFLCRHFVSLKSSVAFELGLCSLENQRSKPLWNPNLTKTYRPLAHFQHFLEMSLLPVHFLIFFKILNSFEVFKETIGLFYQQTIADILYLNVHHHLTTYSWCLMVAKEVFFHFGRNKQNFIKLNICTFLPEFIFLFLLVQTEMGSFIFRKYFICWSYYFCSKNCTELCKLWQLPGLGEIKIMWRKN